MPRIDHYSHHDDPALYFQRLQSYSSSKPSFSRPSSLAPWSHSGVSKVSESDVESASSHGRTESAVSVESASYVDSEVDSVYAEKAARRTQSERAQRSHMFGNSEKEGWSRRRKVVICSIAALVLILIIVIPVVVHEQQTAFHYTPSSAQVTNTTAFTTGGATHNSVNSMQDGIGAGQDKYTYYSGPASSFPPATTWISFENMWTSNLPSMQTSCSALHAGEDNTIAQIADIYTAIQSRANASLVDHRFILAIVLQESHGCVHVPTTHSSTGVPNPGLMQSHAGSSFSPAHQAESILAMVQDGTQGTPSGAGLVQNLNLYGDPYVAARGYNSGYVAASGDLSDAAGATACYVSDVANRLTGWVDAPSTCPGDESS